MGLTLGRGQHPYPPALLTQHVVAAGQVFKPSEQVTFPVACITETRVVKTTSTTSLSIVVGTCV